MPAIGTGHWLGAETPRDALKILGAVGLDQDASLAEIELRHVATSAAGGAVPGAMTRPPGAFVLHATGAAPDPAGRAAVNTALQTVLASAASSAIGRDCPSYCDGQTEALNAFEPATGQRRREIARMIDPDGIIDRARKLYR